MRQERRSSHHEGCSRTRCEQSVTRRLGPSTQLRALKVCRGNLQGQPTRRSCKQDRPGTGVFCKPFKIQLGCSHPFWSSWDRVCTLFTNPPCCEGPLGRQQEVADAVECLSPMSQTGAEFQSPDSSLTQTSCNRHLGS